MSSCPNCRQPILPDDIYCGSCGTALPGRAPVAMPMPPLPIGAGRGPTTCPTCGQINEPDALFCERDGTPLSAPLPGAQGVLVMPDQSEITLPQTGRTLGRSDLLKYAKPENTKEISRGHFTITQEQGAFYVQDGGPDPANPNAWKPSKNGTAVNGVVLGPASKQKLNPNDVIDVAQLGLNMTFKSR
jgi:hypothetical protein